VITWVIYNYQGAKSQGSATTSRARCSPRASRARSTAGHADRVRVHVHPAAGDAVHPPAGQHDRRPPHPRAVLQRQHLPVPGLPGRRWWTAFFGLGSFAGAVVFTFFEVLVSALQAYIFTLLTAVYLAGSLEPEH
jgi:hypothetical protein